MGGIVVSSEEPQSIDAVLLMSKNCTMQLIQPTVYKLTSPLYVLQPFFYV